MARNAQILACLLTLFALFAPGALVPPTRAQDTAPLALPPATSGGLPEETFPIDRILRWEGPRHGTLGPTGKRLFTERIDEAPGLRGVFTWLLPSDALTDPVRLAFRNEEGPLTLEHVKTIWRPSHLEARWRLAGRAGAPEGSVQVVERKFITEEDALVDRVLVINDSPEPIDLEAVVTGEATPMLERFRSRQVHVDLSAAANLHPFPGRRIFTDGRPAPWIRVDGERPYSRLRESADPIILQAIYVAVCPDIPDGETPALTIRYARGGEGPVFYRLLIDGEMAGDVKFEATGGWGDDDADWRTICVTSDRLRPGLRKIVFNSCAREDGVRIGEFFIAAESASLPPFETGAGRPAAGAEHVLYLPGSIDYDGVRYDLPDPEATGRPTQVALRGARPGDRAAGFPDRARIALPDMGRSPCTWHFLTAVATPRGRDAGAPAALRFRLDDGSEETVLLPEAADRAEERKPPPDQCDGRAEWRRLFLLPLSVLPCDQLAYTPPPGRFAKEVFFEKRGDPPAIPILIAATAEEPPVTGHLPLYLGRSSIAGMNVSFALAGSAFVPVKNAEVKRVLVRSMQIEPGGAEEFTLAVATADRDDRAARAALRVAGEDDPFRRHIEVTRRWYEDHVPCFACSDPFIEKAWHYRWFIVRHNMVRPGIPPLTAPLFYEGTHGMERTGVRAARTHHVLAETRWLRDRRFATGHLRSHLRTVIEAKPGGDLFFRDVHLAREGALSRNAEIPPAGLGVYHVHNDEQYIEEVHGLLERNLIALKIGIPQAPWDPPPRRSGEEIAERIRRLTALHFFGGNLSRPYRELPPIDGETCPDGFADAYNDLLIRYVGGLVPHVDKSLYRQPADGEEEEFIVLEPITELPLEHFRFRRIRYHGHDLEIVWIRPGTAVPWPDRKEGYSLYVDGRPVARRADLGHLRAPLQ